MSDKYSPEQGEGQRSGNERGNSRQLLLLILLLLVAGFGYIYYFTGLIKPRQEETKPPAEQAVQVKKPLPPRPAGPEEKPAAAPSAQDAAKSAAAKPSTPPPAAVAPPAKAEKPVAPVQKPQPTENKPVAAAVPAQPKPAVQAAKPAPARPEPQKKAQHEAPTAAGKGKGVTAAAPPKPAVKKEEKAAPAPAPVKANTAPPKAETKVAKPAAPKEQGRYALQVGAYVLDKELKAAEAKLKKAGMTGIGKKKTSRVEPMNRLFLADFADHGAAVAELQKLRKLTNDAFILPENGKYGVYAGSYYLGNRALSEKDRLEAKGVSLTVKNVETRIQATTITAGAFSAREDAEKAARRLKKEGIDASVIRTGKGD